MAPKRFNEGDYPPGTRKYQQPDTSPPVLSCTTRDQRTVVLSERQWHGHIADGHPEMRELLNYIEWSLRAPERITRDRVDPARQCYYVGYTSRRGLSLWIRTVVHFDASVTGRYGVEGFVVTSHIARRINPKEEQLWP